MVQGKNQDFFKLLKWFYLECHQHCQLSVLYRQFLLQLQRWISLKRTEIEGQNTKKKNKVFFWQNTKSGVTADSGDNVGNSLRVNRENRNLSRKYQNACSDRGDRWIGVGVRTGWDSRMRGCFAQVQLRSQWQLHLSGHASKKKAGPDCHVRAYSCPELTCSSPNGGPHPFLHSQLWAELSGNLGNAHTPALQ